MGNRVEPKVALITFGVFMTEAILHYNMGENSDKENKKFKFPPTKDFIKLGVVVGIFSIVNGIIIGKLSKI